MQFTQQIRCTRKYVTGAQLRQTLAATSVRIRDGRRVVTDGPFAETCEQSTTASLSPPILHVPTACPKLAEASLASSRISSAFALGPGMSSLSRKLSKAC